MVCSIGTVKMAHMDSLVASPNFSQLASENAAHQKVVAQYIQKELLEADDANMLDEEDMHIFDLHPLTDPLRLVSCNFCKKPVMASQFVTHSELCRSLGIAGELLSEFDSGTGNRKPPRKERKKLVSGGKRVKMTGGQERFAVVDASQKAVTCSQLDEQVGISVSCLVEAKGISRTIGGLAGEIVPLTKRPKMITADTGQTSEEIQTARGVSNVTSFQNSIPYVPAPLAAKTYTSQRNNRLQAAISHMYHQSSVKGGCIIDKGWQENLIVSEEEMNNQLEKSYGHSTLNKLKTNQTFRQDSAGGLFKAEGQPSNNFVNQVSMIDGNVSEATTAAAGTTATSNHPKPYPFANNSGLTTVQRPTGGVPVI